MVQRTRLVANDRLGPYEVAALLGAGGMGEVYKARDTRLDRVVALKVLRAPVASDPVLRQRFEREARTISALQHPNICAVHDVGEHSGIHYLVMEYLDGESLASRLAKGPLPMEQVLAIGVQLADALARAHRDGIVHRDLKPANVMLTRSGAKLLDFGLARAASPVPADGVDVNLTSNDGPPGTYPYMAPEQLEGQPFDHRADIWALGCVLFEMAAGRKAFPGRTPSELMRAILHDELPRLATVVPEAPAALDHVVRVCLERAPEARWQSAVDVARELGWIQDSSGARRTMPVRPRSRRWSPWVAALAVLAALGAGAGWWRAARRPAPRVVRASLLPPARAVLPTLPGSLAVSPDGARIAFTVRDDSGRTRIAVRALDAPDAVEVPGTEGGTQPFWSPDGRQLGFFAAGVLQHVAVSGGPPEPFSPAPFLFGATWGADDVVVAATRLGGPLTLFRDGGRSTSDATTLDTSRGERAHVWPHFLPDGRRFLYTVQRLDPTTGQIESEIWAQAVGASDRTRVTRAASNAVFVAPDRLLFALDGNVVAQRLDPGTLQVAGDPQVVAHGAVWDDNSNAALFSAAGDVIAYAPGGTVGRARIVVLDRAGRPQAQVAPDADSWTPRVSPDGTQVAAERIDRRTGNRDLYLYDVQGARPPLRLTFDPGDEFTPVWSRDGRRLAYSAQRGGRWSLVTRELQGAETERPVPAGVQAAFPTDWGPRGLYVNRMVTTNNVDVVLVAEDGAVRPLLDTPALERDAVLSPDGRYLAFAAWTSGRPDVFVHEVDGDGRWQISTEGGRQPRWSRDGREIFYFDAQSRLVAVAVGGAGAFRPQAPQPLFALRLRQTQVAQYDVRPDGTFVANVEVGEPAYPAIGLVTGWKDAR